MKKPYRNKKEKQLLDQIKNLEVQSESTALGGLSVLIVDDSPKCIGIIKHHLKQLGIFQVHYANDEVSAIEYATKYRPDLLIVDVMLPRVNGFNLVKLLEEYISYTLPVIYITANTSFKKEFELKLGEGEDYLFKPVRAEDLSEKIEFLFAEKAA